MNQSCCGLKIIALQKDAGAALSQAAWLGSAALSLCPVPAGLGLSLPLFNLTGSNH